MFSIEMAVRDYECDIQGIVNNGIYQHYFEHARHEYIKHRGYDFNQITQSGIKMVIYRAEIDYQHPLQSGDSFIVTVDMEPPKKVRSVFNQTISINDKIHTRGKFFVTALNQANKPVKFTDLDLNRLFTK